MTATPRVSVVLPTYNCADHLGPAIESVLAQTYEDFELLVVDDASTDATAEVVARFQGDARVRHLRHEVNRGPSAARNTGIHAATGELIAFIDADDHWAPGKLEAQVAAMEDPTVGVCCVAAWYLMPGDSTVVVKKQPPFEGDALYRELLFSNSIPAGGSGTMVRRSCFAAAGDFDEALRGAEDRDLWVRLAARCRFVFLDTPLLYFDRRRPDSAVTDAVRMARGREGFLRNRERDMPAHLRPLLPRLRRTTFLFVAKSFAQTGDATTARKYCVRAIVASRRLDREFWKAVRFLARSSAPSGLQTVFGRPLAVPPSDRRDVRAR